MKSLFIPLIFLLLTACDNKFDWIEPPTELPIVHSISPDSGIPGTEVKVSGEHFSGTISNNSITINGTSATITQASASSLTFIAPNEITGPVVVVVNNQAAENTPVFTYK